MSPSRCRSRTPRGRQRSRPARRGPPPMACWRGSRTLAGAPGRGPAGGRPGAWCRGPAALPSGPPRPAADGVLAGFENHGGRTELGTGARALGRVLKGHGNDGRSGLEGARQGNILGTYLHGPLLPKNVWFADWLIARALG